MASERFLKLSCAVQTYSWGKSGQNSEVAKLKLGDPTFTLHEDVSYAEVNYSLRAICINRDQVDNNT